MVGVAAVLAVGAVVGLVPVWLVLDVFVVQLNRVMPVPDGGPNLDPLPSDRVEGVWLWGGFVTVLLVVVALLHPTLRRRRVLHLERAAQRSTASRIR